MPGSGRRGPCSTLPQPLSQLHSCPGGGGPEEAGAGRSHGEGSPGASGKLHTRHLAWSHT